MHGSQQRLHSAKQTHGLFKTDQQAMKEVHQSNLTLSVQFPITSKELNTGSAVMRRCKWSQHNAKTTNGLEESRDSF